MAFWGVEINQCDEFCKVYDEFIHHYETGFEIKDITSLILKKYIGHFPKDDNVYFAIAKAEWSLGSLSQEIKQQVISIVDSGDDISYYRSLGFSKAELNDREKALRSFIKLLDKDKKIPKSKRISSHNQFKHLPKGTVGWYRYNDEYYGFLVLDAVYEGRLLAITPMTTRPPDNIEAVMESSVMTAIWLILNSVPKGYQTIGKIDIPSDYNGRAGVFICKPIHFGINYTFNLCECHRRILVQFQIFRIHDLLDSEKVPIEFFLEGRKDLEADMVKDLINNPSSKIAKEMIREALFLNK